MVLTTVSRVRVNYRRPDWARRINAMGDAVGNPRGLVSLDPDELLAVATESVGEDDFGSETWREPFRRLACALDEEADLNTLGRLMTRQELIRGLRTRLLLQRARRENAAIENEAVTAPIVITGPARSGTTLLHHLLGKDPQLRAPLAWEVAHPVPLPGDSEDRRVELAECEFDLWADIQPEQAAIHEHVARLPVECIHILALEYDPTYWVNMVNVPTWTLWRLFTDLEPVYRFHESFLQVLQHGEAPRRWILKSPAHLGRLATLFAVYPDARVIHTHRDPLKTVPSTVSMVATIHWLRTETVPAEDLAQLIPVGFHMLLTDVIEARTDRSLPDDQIVDIQYLDLMRDPVASIERLYSELGLAFDRRFADTIRSHRGTKPRTEHGVHGYSLEQFGLSADDLRRTFLNYTDHYGIEFEV